MGLASPVNVSKRGLFARLYVPNKTLIIVKSRLPKENLISRTGGPQDPQAAQTAPSKWPNSTRRLSNGNRPPAGYASGRFHRRQVWGISAAANLMLEKPLVLGVLRLVVGRGRTLALLGHEGVELLLVLGVAQTVEELAEFTLLLLQAPQRLGAIFIEGAVAT